VLKSIRLKNFKLREDTSIEAAPITVFIGPNNSGKSSIFQALLALRQGASRGSDVLVEPANRQATSPDQPYLFPGDGIIDLGETSPHTPPPAPLSPLAGRGVGGEGAPFPGASPPATNLTPPRG
jgi:energy-coupling factor transporter ATP-binding protein EcfA2